MHWRPLQSGRGQLIKDLAFGISRWPSPLERRPSLPTSADNPRPEAGRPPLPARCACSAGIKPPKYTTFARTAGKQLSRRRRQGRMKISAVYKGWSANRRVGVVRQMVGTEADKCADPNPFFIAEVMDRNERGQGGTQPHGTNSGRRLAGRARLGVHGSARLGAARPEDAARTLFATERYTADVGLNHSATAPAAI